MIQILFSMITLFLPAMGDKENTLPDETKARIEHVQTYLTAKDASARRPALRELLKASHTEIAAALQQAQIWEDMEPGFSTVQVNVPSAKKRTAKTLEVEVHLPKGYDPANAYPLLLAYHGQGGNGKNFIKAAIAILREKGDTFIVAAPTDYDGMWLGSTAEATEEPRKLLQTLKRRYHIDTDRVYAMGYSLGGHASFLMATFFGDSFAAVVPLAGTFAIQMGSACVDVLLPNARNVPMLVVYGENDQSIDPTTGKPAGIAVWNRFLKHSARRLDLPITMVELPGVGHGGVIPPEDALQEILSKRRGPLHHTLSHRFRYTSQSRVEWLRQTRFAGRPWSSQQLVVSPGAGESPEEAMAAMLDKKLGGIAGTIEGQHIQIHTLRCHRIELLLNDDLVDLDKAIRITVDGTVRFEGIAKRSVKTMLEVAKENWEFKRLFPVRFQIGKKGRAILK
ncbi:MAG: hypothetical protein GXP29_02400 [Planctomycetes bacterium]|nr:hypothetical protein [Planctomycetota bacterium]